VLKEKIIDKTLSSADLPITVDRSRCMRMRFNKNECPVCTDNCHAEAITFGEDIFINAGKCTLCMVCVSECPADCFDIKGGDFFRLLARLRKIQHSVPLPVLGCKTASGSGAHEKTACLGSLSDEHLLAVYVFMDKPVHVNLTACAQCRNAFIVDALKDRIRGIHKSTGIDVSEKILLIEHKADLSFEDVSYDRRGFFKALKNLGFVHAADLLESGEGEIIRSYSAKKLPLKRDILNTIIKKITDLDISGRILQEYAFTATADASCNNCFSCIGMCPTGALKIKSDESGVGLLFNSSLCNGCALCRDFCFNNSITLSYGYAGENFFEHELCNKDSFMLHESDREAKEDTVAAGCYEKSL